MLSHRDNALSCLQDISMISKLLRISAESSRPSIHRYGTKLFEKSPEKQG